MRSHGKSKSDEYRAWAKLRSRCNNPNVPRYPRYGGRGITVCERWESFENFLADMGPRPSAEHSIDRIDNDGNYEPGNCRWATKAQQANNKRNSRRITHNGVTRTLPEWARHLGIAVGTLRRRIDVKGVPVHRALDSFVKAGVQWLTPGLVREVVAMLKSGQRVSVVSATTGVSVKMLRSIRSGKAWREVVSDDDVAQMLASVPNRGAPKDVVRIILESNLGPTELAKRLGLSRRTVWLIRSKGVAA